MKFFTNVLDNTLAGFTSKFTSQPKVEMAPIPEDEVGNMNDHAMLVGLITAVLEKQGVRGIQQPDIKRFAGELEHSQSMHAEWMERLRRFQESSGHPQADGEFGVTDILYWMDKAVRDGDRDEALWRAFLAAHFGRMSCDGNLQKIDSAGRLLCGFGDEPVWTWQRASSDLDGLETWLHQHREQLATLQFGNHQKFQAKKPDILFDVLESIVMWVERNGGTPQRAFDIQAESNPKHAFDKLYRRLMGMSASQNEGIYKFGRTACFDMLLLLRDMGLVKISPGSCYLKGSTGPLQGAQMLWGKHLSMPALEKRAEDLAREINVPCDIVEDALCMWQK